VTHRREELRFRDRGLERRVPRFAELGCDALALGDVAGVHDEAADAAVLEQVGRRALQQDPSAVAMTQPEVQRHRRSGLRVRVDERLDHLALVRRVHQVGELRVRDLGRRVPEHPLGGRTLVLRDRVLVEHGDQVGRVVHEGPEPGRLSLAAATQQQGHRNGRAGGEQTEHDLDAHQA